VAGGDHFINDGPPEALMSALEACIPAKKAWVTLPQMPRLRWSWLRLGPEMAHG